MRFGVEEALGEQHNTIQIREFFKKKITIVDKPIESTVNRL